MTIEMVTEELTGPGVWYGPDIRDDQSWNMHLDGDDVAEIDGALAAGRQHEGIPHPRGGPLAGVQPVNLGRAVDDHHHLL